MLAVLLENGTRQIWPTNKAMEAIFDLGERRYNREEYQRNLERCAVWLSTYGVESGEPLTITAPSTHQALRMRLGLEPDHLAVGVAKDLPPLAKLLCICEKTLSNSLTYWCRSDRLEHRWLLFLGRWLEHNKLPPGYLYHRRSFFSLKSALTRVWGHLQVGQPDTADAMLLLSLIALWQRRRPTGRVRANRGRTTPRSRTPKPAVQLSGELMVRGQLEPTLSFAVEREAGALLCLLFELALTEAHLVPHLKNKKQGSLISAGWLEQIEKELHNTKVALLLGEEYEFFRYRVHIMKAYRDRETLQKPPSEIEGHPYIQAAWHVYWYNYHRKQGISAESSILELQRLMQEPDWEGKAMYAETIASQLEKSSCVA